MTYVLIAVVAAVLLLIIAPAVSDWSIRKALYRLTLVGMAMSSWNAVIIKGIRPTDLILVIVLPLIVIDALVHREFRGLPRQLFIGASLIALAGLLTHFRGPSSGYLSGRIDVVSARVQFGAFEARSSNLTQLAKFEIALLVVPLIIVLLRPSLIELRRLAGAWLISVLISCLVGVTDHVAITHISNQLIGYESRSARESGLTLHSNYLAAACALAIPIACLWLGGATKQGRFAGAAAIVLLLVGALLTGSRGGAVAVALSFSVSLLALRGTRWVIGVVATAFPLFVLVGYGQLNGIIQSVLTQTRLDGGQTAEVSSATRAVLRNQGFADFFYHPVQGIGYSIIGQAQEVHIGLLAAGGLLGFLGWAIYMYGSILQVKLARTVDRQLANAFLVTIIAWLALNFVENQVTDRFLYVPAGILIALVHHARSRKAEEPALVTAGAV